INVATGEIMVGSFNAHSLEVTLVIFTLDGQQIITTSRDNSGIRVWDSANGQQVGEPMLGHKLDVSQIALSPDGQRMASAATDLTVRVWDLRTQRQLGGPLQYQGYLRVGLLSVAWSPDGTSIVAGDRRGNIHIWTVPPLESKTAVAPPDATDLTENSPQLPSTSRARANSLSSSVLELPAGSSPTPPQSPELDDGASEDDNWEYFTNESFDSVLDLPADGTQPAQKRKRRRRRPAAAPVASTSSPPISAPPIINPPSHPPLNQTLASPVQTIPGPHATADAPAVRVGALHRLWRQRRTLPRWTRRKARENHDSGEPIPAPNVPTSSIGPQPQPTPGASTRGELATGHVETAPPKSTVISRLLARSKRNPTDTIPDNIEMHPPWSPQRRHRTPRTRRQSEVVNVAAGRLDQRLAASSNKWTDKIDWLDYICFCMCCPWNKVISESDSERQQGGPAGAGGASGSSSSSSSDRVDFNPNNIY
ncbi:hypothetical protein BJ138DRAFT_1159353, partial [Hygrophoropsis aurantiaca]